MEGEEGAFYSPVVGLLQIGSGQRNDFRMSKEETGDSVGRRIKTVMVNNPFSKVDVDFLAYKQLRHGMR